MKFEKISIKEVIKKYLESKEIFNLYVKKDGSDFLKVNSIELNFEEDIIGVHTLEYYEGDRLIFDTDVQDTFYIMVEEGETKAEIQVPKILEYKTRGCRYHWANRIFTTILDSSLMTMPSEFDSFIYSITGETTKSQWARLKYSDYKESDGKFEDLMDRLIDNGEDLTEEQFTVLFEEQEWEEVEKAFADILDEIE